MSVLPLVGSIACGDGSSDSSEPTMPRKVSSNAGRRVQLVGQKATITVSDQRVGERECHEAQGCNGKYMACSTPTEAVDSKVESVTCAEAGCTARVASTTKGSATIEVESTRAATTEVVVTMRDDRGELIETRASIEWKAATAIDIQRFFLQSPHGATYASLVGAEYRWCAEVTAPEDLGELAQDALVVEASGALTLDSVEKRFGSEKATCFRFRAWKKGTGEVHVASGGFEKRISIDVVDASDVASVDLLVLPESAGSEREGIDVDPFAGVAATASLALPECPFGPVSLIVPRLVLKNGSHALGGAESLTSASSALGLELAPTWKTGSVVRAAAREPGETTISFTIGTVTQTVPVTIGGTCPSN